ATLGDNTDTSVCLPCRWWNNTFTCKEVTLRSSSDMYCSFLTRDRCADCLFARILQPGREFNSIQFNSIVETE
ncbi:unnamed protein product, partial [Linum tenue]